MNETHRIAQLLVACWRLGGDESRIPTSQGLLDRALKAATEKGVFPAWAVKRLHFVDSRIGLQCAELPGILEWAQRSQLTTAPNPSYETTEVQISKRVARRLLNSLGVSPEEAKKWGETIRDEIGNATRELSEFEYSRIEDY